MNLRWLGLKGFGKINKSEWKKLDLKIDSSCKDGCNCGDSQEHTEMNKKVTFEEVNIRTVERENLKMRLRFQVADVVKPLISVKRITEKGNKVCFGPETYEIVPNL